MGRGFHAVESNFSAPAPAPPACARLARAEFDAFAYQARAFSRRARRRAGPACRAPPDRRSHRARRGAGIAGFAARVSNSRPPAKSPCAISSSLRRYNIATSSRSSARLRRGLGRRRPQRRSIAPGAAMPHVACGTWACGIWASGATRPAAPGLAAPRPRTDPPARGGLAGTASDRLARAGADQARIVTRSPDRLRLHGALQRERRRADHEEGRERRERDRAGRVNTREPRSGGGAGTTTGSSVGRPRAAASPRVASNGVSPQRVPFAQLRGGRQHAAQLPAAASALSAAATGASHTSRGASRALARSIACPRRRIHRCLRAFAGVARTGYS